MKKKVLALAMALVMLASLVTVPAGAVGNKTFPDAVGHWAEESILRWSRCGLVKGDEVGNVNPNKPLRRCEMATILSDMLGLRTAAPISTFKDINGDEWYARAILRCAAAGIMEGSNSMSYPEDHITREEAITMFGRALGVQPSDDPDLSDFLDGDKVSGWAAPYMATLTELGILSGMGDGIVAPHADINRAGAFTLMDKAISVYANAPGVYTSQNANGFVVVNANDHQGGDVTVTGKATGVMVTVGETNTVRFRDLTAENIQVNGKGDVVVTGKSEVDALTVNTEIAVNVDKDVSVGTLDVKAEKVTVTNAGTVKTLNCAEVGNVTNSGKVENLVADAASAITNTGTVDKLVANAAITVDNTKGTVKNAEINMGGVVMDGSPQQMTIASGVARPANSSGRPISATGAVSSSGGGSGSSSNRPTPKPTPGIKLDKATATVTAGETVALKATVTLPASNAIKGDVIWSSNDETIATVNENGTVTAVKEGKATITATVTVTIPDPTPSPSPSASPSETADPTQTTEPTETAEPTQTVDPEPSESTNPDPTTPVEGGDNTEEGGATEAALPPAAPAAVRAGVPVVHADKTETYTATCTVTVKAKPVETVAVTGVTLNETELTLEEGETADLTATIAPENATNKNMTWTSSDPDTATVDENGHVTAKKAGETPAVITVTTEDGGKTATCKVTVNEKTVTPPDEPAVTGVTITSEVTTVKVNETITLTAKVEVVGDMATTVKWTSSNTDCATVDESTGEVTGVAKGTATITATSAADETKSATCTVTVTDDTTPTEPEVKLDKEAVTLTLVADTAVTETLSVTVDGETTTESITWASDNTDVATVAEGVVTAKTAGTAHITATLTVNGKEYTLTCTVTVNPVEKPTPPEENYTITLNQTSLELVCNETYQLTATITPENSGKQVTWSSDDNTKATVTADGLVKAVAATGDGEPTSGVVITAKIEGTEKEFKAECAVKIVQPVTLTVEVTKDGVTVGAAQETQTGMTIQLRDWLQLGLEEGQTAEITEVSTTPTQVLKPLDEALEQFLVRDFGTATVTVKITTTPAEGENATEPETVVYKITLTVKTTTTEPGGNEGGDQGGGTEGGGGTTDPGNGESGGGETSSEPTV